MKFKIPAHNIILFWAGILNFKFKIVFWNIFFQDLEIQADGAIGEPSDESDFSLLAWDSFSQEIRDLFTVVRSITSDYLYSIVKTL